jgi:hypothetical protein
MPRRPGRPRKDGPRKPSGKPWYAAQVGPTPELAAKRLALIGDRVVPESRGYMNRARDARCASYLLGMLLARALIDATGHAAGMRYAGAFRYAARPLTGFVVPRPDWIPGVRPLGDTVVGADDARANFSAARRSLQRCGPRITAAVERVALYEQAIEQEELPLLREGLAALDEHFSGR